MSTPAAERVQAIGPKELADGMEYARILTVRVIESTGRKPSPQEWDDLRCAAFRAVARCVKHYDPRRGNWSTLLHRAVPAEVKREHVRQSRWSAQRPVASLEWAEGERPDFFQCTEPGYAEVEMRELFSLLTTRQRAVIHLRYWEQLEYREIGARLGISRSTAQYVESQALAILRKAIH